MKSKKSAKITVVASSEATENSKPIHTEVTIGFAHTVHGEGTAIHWRPDSKINPVDPDSDLAILIN